MTAGDVEKEWAEAMESIMSYSEGQRDEAVKKAESLPDSMDSRIDKMESQAESQWNDMSKEARMKRQEALQSLRRQRSELSEWYGGMKRGSKSARADVKKGFSDAYNALSSTRPSDQTEPARRFYSGRAVFGIELVTSIL